MKQILKTFLVTKSDCHEWNGHVTKNGYGLTYCNKKTCYVHRLVYEYYFGSIPTGFQIDHLCKNRKCMNPNHLEAVTQKENILRSDGITAIQSRQTHCVHGHPLSGDNLYVSPKKHRSCKTCRRNHRHNYWMVNQK